MPSLLGGGGVSKRQQQRNENALRDLIRSVPGNDRCADCEAMNPGWASWNMGIFLCMRCAALHRKLGTHISKVKSLSMDTWTAEQVDSMKSHGNVLMNKIFNPKNVKPAIPTDADEADSCMERYIRQKYQYRSLEDGKPKPPSRHDSGYDRSPEGSPPPLPPKSSRILGLRSASSTSNLNRLSNRSHTTSPRSERPVSPPPVSSNSGPQGFGASVDNSSDTLFESKMATLREMGFTNERRNAAALKGLDGNLDKAIETLVRVGEGPASRARTPASTITTSDNVASTNPFDQLDSKPTTQPMGNSYNPFGMPTSQPQQQPTPAQPLEMSFQNLQVSQPLFPHSTGGHPNQQGLLPHTHFQQSAPPVTSDSSQGAFVTTSQSLDGSQNPFFQTGAQPQATFANASFAQNPSVAQTNPYFTQFTPQATSTQQQSVPSIAGPNPLRHANTMPALSSTSPFAQVPSFQQQLQPVQQGQGSYNPFQPMTAPTTPQYGGHQNPFQSQWQQGLQQPSQYLSSQPTGRVDKNNILSLYNNSPAPSSGMPQQQQFQAQAPLGSSSVPGLGSTPQAQPASNPNMPQNNQLGADLSSRNPFMTAPPGAPGVSQTQPGLGYGMTMNAPQMNGGLRSHISQQSVDINGFQNGRHSPDAFASLSARYG